MNKQILGVLLLGTMLSVALCSGYPSYSGGRSTSSYTKSRTNRYDPYSSYGYGNDYSYKKDYGGYSRADKYRSNRGYDNESYNNYDDDYKSYDYNRDYLDYYKPTDRFTSKKRYFDWNDYSANYNQNYGNPKKDARYCTCDEQIQITYESRKMSNYVCENTSDENCAYDLKEAFEYYSDVDKDKEGYCFVNHMSWPTWHQKMCPKEKTYEGPIITKTSIKFNLDQPEDLTFWFSTVFAHVSVLFIDGDYYEKDQGWFVHHFIDQKYFCKGCHTIDIYEKTEVRNKKLWWLDIKTALMQKYGSGPIYDLNEEKLVGSLCYDDCRHWDRWNPYYYHLLKNFLKSCLQHHTKKGTLHDLPFKASEEDNIIKRLTAAHKKIHDTEENGG